MIEVWRGRVGCEMVTIMSVRLTNENQKGDCVNSEQSRGPGKKKKSNLNHPQFV